MAQHTITGVCTCGNYGDLSDVVGHQEDTAPQNVLIKNTHGTTVILFAARPVRRYRSAIEL